MQSGLLWGGLALLLVTGLLASRLRDARVIPLVMHNLPWSLALLTAGSGLIYYDRLPGSSILLICLGIASFNVGLILNKLLDRPTPQSRPANQRPLISLSGYVALWAAFLVGFATLLWTIHRLFGLATLMTDPIAIRIYSDVQYLVEFPLWGKFLFYLGPLLVALTVNADVVSGLRRVKWPVRYGLVVILLVAQAASLQRTNIFVSIIFALALYVHRSQFDKATVKRTLGGIVLVGLAGGLVFAGIGSALGKTTRANPESVRYYAPAIRDSQISQLLLYGSSGTAAFGKLTQSNNSNWPPADARGVATLGNYNPQTWGAASFSWLLKAVPITRRWPEVEPFTQVPMLTNVYTWLSPWYRDFRWPGVVLMPMLVAFAAGFAARRAPSSYSWGLVAALISVCLMWAPFTNRLTSTMTIELFAISFALLWLERRQPDAILQDSAERMSAREA